MNEKNKCGQIVPSTCSHSNRNSFKENKMKIKENKIRNTAATCLIFCTHITNKLPPKTSANMYFNPQSSEMTPQSSNQPRMCQTAGRKILMKKKANRQTS